jgi:uncharacterized membrane protein
MTVKTLLALVAAALLASCAAAPASNYAGQESRTIKALSSDEVEGYLAGNGMGFAKPAELNGYPGPMHVVQLADELALSPDQRLAARQLLDRHKAEVRALGQRYVDSERALDRLFAVKAVAPSTLEEALKRSADLHRQIRESHLAAHLEMTAMLSPHQVAQYVRMRGYTANSSHQH